MNAEYLVSFLYATVLAGTPLLFGTLGEILTEKSGNLNLGVFSFARHLKERIPGVLSMRNVGVLRNDKFCQKTSVLCHGKHFIRRFVRRIG